MSIVMKVFKNKPAIPSDDFIHVFGPRPQGGDKESKISKQIWDQELRSFQGLIDLPEVNANTETFKKFELGTPVSYMSGGEAFVAFPGAKIYKPRHYDPFTAATSVGNVIAKYQMRLIDMGIYVPDRLGVLPDRYLLMNERNKPSE